MLLGDVFETGPRLEETVALLSGAGTVGVWGNHDFGICCDPSPYVLERFSRGVLDYMAGLRPRLEIDDCLFTHIEPWLDATDIRQLWHVEDEPLSPALIARSLDAVPHRVVFLGHFHRWLVATREHRLGWHGRWPLRLPIDRRFLVIVNGVSEGWCATYETTTGELVPHDLGEGAGRAGLHASG